MDFFIINNGFVNGVADEVAREEIVGLDERKVGENRDLSRFVFSKKAFGEKSNVPG